jgi:hypothetical protein
VLEELEEEEGEYSGSEEEREVSSSSSSKQCEARVHEVVVELSCELHIDYGAPLLLPCRCAWPAPGPPCAHGLGLSPSPGLASSGLACSPPCNWHAPTLLHSYRRRRSLAPKGATWSCPLLCFARRSAWANQLDIYCQPLLLTVNHLQPTFCASQPPAARAARPYLLQLFCCLQYSAPPPPRPQTPSVSADSLRLQIGIPPSPLPLPLPQLACRVSGLCSRPPQTPPPCPAFAVCLQVTRVHEVVLDLNRELRTHYGAPSVVHFYSWLLAGVTAGVNSPALTHAVASFLWRIVLPEHLGLEPLMYQVRGCRGGGGGGGGASAEQGVTAWRRGVGGSRSCSAFCCLNPLACSR